MRNVLAAPLRPGPAVLGQYISLKHVLQREFELIDTRRSQLGPKALFTYFPDIETFTIKVPSPLDRLATLSGRERRLIREPGLSAGGDIANQRTT